MSNKLTEAEAITLAMEWHELHDDANNEESAECHGVAERLRMQAADIEHKLRTAGFEAHQLAEDELRRRKARG